MASINIDNKNTKEFNDDLKNLVFFKKNSFQRVNTNFIKLLYYYNINNQFAFKDIFIKIKEGIYQSYKNYIHIEPEIGHIIKSRGARHDRTDA